MALDLDPGCDEAQRPVWCGLAERTEDRVALVHPEMAAVVTHQLDKALQRQMVSAVSDYTTAMVVSGRWEATNS